MASTVDSDAKPGVLSGRVQMESHPHLSLKWEKDGATSSRQQRQPLPAGTGNRKRDAVLLMKKVKVFIPF